MTIWWSNDIFKWYITQLYYLVKIHRIHNIQLCLTDLAYVGNANAAWAWQGHLTQLCIDARLFNDACTSLRIVFDVHSVDAHVFNDAYILLHYYTVHSASHTKLLVTPLLMKLEFKIFMASLFLFSFCKIGITKKPAKVALQQHSS